MFQFSSALSTKQVRWEKSMCLAAKRSLQGRAAKLLLLCVGVFVFFFFNFQSGSKLSVFFRLVANEWLYALRIFPICLTSSIPGFWSVFIGYFAHSYHLRLSYSGIVRYPNDPADFLSVQILSWLHGYISGWLWGYHVPIGFEYI